LVDQIKSARGEPLKQLLSGISMAMTDVANATRTAWSTLIMLGKGIVTAGSFISKAAADLQYSLDGIDMIALCVSVLGVAGAGEILAAIIATIGSFLVLLKDCLNVLLVINNEIGPIDYISEAVMYGERGDITDKIPAADANLMPDFVYGAFFSYRKSHVGVIPFGLYGTTFGICLSATRKPSSGTKTENFCVGMDCPLTVLGGTNSIRLLYGSDPAQAAKLADASGNEEDKLSSQYSGSVLARRAAQWGNVNWAFCSVDPAASTA